MKYHEIWTYEIVDFALIPQEYLMVDDKSLASLARSLRDQARVPGVRFFPEQHTAVSIQGR